MSDGELVEREKRLRIIFDHALQFMGLLTPEGILLETNQSSLEAGAVQAHEVIGKPFWECPWWKHSEKQRERLRKSIQRAAQGQPVRHEMEYVAADGSPRVVDFSLRPVCDDTGKVIFIVPEGRDITDVQQAAQQLENMSRRLHLATQAAKIGIWDWNLTDSSLNWDEQMRRIYGIKESDTELTFEVWRKMVHPDDQKMVASALQEALAGKATFDTVFRILWQDGSTHYIQAKGLVQWDSEGNPVRMLGTNADITQQVMVEAGLHESEERFRHAFEYSAVGLALLEPDGTWMAVNKAVCDIVGYSEKELLKLTFQDITHPEDLSKDLDNVQRLIRGDVTHYQMEKRYIHREGRVVWILLTASLVRERDGSPAYFISQIEDITQRHEAEQVLKHQQEQLRLLIEHTPAAVAMFDMEMCYVAASRRWVEDYHLDSSSLVGRCHYDIFPEIGGEWRTIHSRCLAGEVESREEDMFVRHDGRQEWLRWEVRPWFQVSGEIGGVVMFTEVITERKYAAEKIRASLEEKEVLLREIHHRVKNNMQIISSLLQLQTASLHDSADVEIFKDCQTRIHAMAMVHDRLYRSGNLSTINFGAHVKELAGLLIRGQADGGKNIRLETRCEDVELDLDKAVPLGLIATELITNAFKHAFKDRTSGTICVSLEPAEDSRMRLRVADDGPGLAPDPDSSRPRTLGLRLVRSLSHQLRAKILFLSDSPGCCVEITFDI
ncbi:PAS domain S-box protein [Prosthecobacter debontii]|uniref:PAS domain S-box protein n=1 Tax=Prosthecobacter debontii TaxID=48467 RepID=UPI001591AF60|nr:PAS domain S-box protein [Prosthecobacter debontii]